MRRSDTKPKRAAALLAGAAWLVLGSEPLLAEEGAGADSVEALRELSIEQLAQLEVTSASKQAEPISRAPTSIFVITGGEALRSPATSLPELLRLAPNLQVQPVVFKPYRREILAGVLDQVLAGLEGGGS